MIFMTYDTLFIARMTTNCYYNAVLLYKHEHKHSHRLLKTKTADIHVPTAPNTPIACHNPPNYYYIYDVMTPTIFRVQYSLATVRNLTKTAMTNNW